MTILKMERPKAMFGYPLGSLKPLPERFLRKHSKEPTKRTPKKLPKHIPRSVEKTDYGKVPKYLLKFNKIFEEKRSKLDMMDQQPEGVGTQPNTHRLAKFSLS
eukprot:c20496_g1_i2 orf=195-503(-)